MQSIEISPTLLIFIGIICVVMGVFATMLINSLRDEVEVPVEGEETPPGGRKGRYTSIVRLWRERGSGKLVVELDGKSLVSPEPLNELQRERLEKVSADFAVWLGTAPVVYRTEENALPAASPLASQPQVMTDQPEAAPPAPLTAQKYVQPVGNTSSAPYAAPTMYRTAVAIDPVDEVVTVGPKSIVMQIEDILQDQLAGTPYAGRGIHLREDPIRGVIVLVGTTIYEGIDSVSDPEIKAILRTAVATWEKRA
jgi:hypothetical protein